MVGHQQIVAARMEGRKPQAIFVEIGFPPAKPHFGHGPMRHVTAYLFGPTYDPEQAMAIGCYPRVYVVPTDVDAPLDLRFVRDCQVHLGGCELNRDLIGLGERMAAAGASKVVIGTDDGDIMVFNDGEWSSHVR